MSSALPPGSTKHLVAAHSDSEPTAWARCWLDTGAARRRLAVPRFAHCLRRTDIPNVGLRSQPTQVSCSADCTAAGALSRRRAPLANCSEHRPRRCRRQNCLTRRPPRACLARRWLDCHSAMILRRYTPTVADSLADCRLRRCRRSLESCPPERRCEFPARSFPRRELQPSRAVRFAARSAGAGCRRPT